MQTINTLPCKLQRFIKRIALWAAVAAFAGTSLISHNLVQAARPSVPIGTAGTVSGAVSLIDHSSLGNANLLPEPNAALLHSDPKEYVQVAATLR